MSIKKSIIRGMLLFATYTLQADEYAQERIEKAIESRDLVELKRVVRHLEDMKVGRSEIQNMLKAAERTMLRVAKIGRNYSNVGTLLGGFLIVKGLHTFFSATKEKPLKYPRDLKKLRCLCAIRDEGCILKENKERAGKAERERHFGLTLCGFSLIPLLFGITVGSVKMAEALEIEEYIKTYLDDRL